MSKLYQRMVKIVAGMLDTFVDFAEVFSAKSLSLLVSKCDFDTF